METYFDVAERDYLFLKENYERGRIGNIMCYSAHFICERYLKHVLCQVAGKENVPEAHSLKSLRSSLRKEVPDFSCDWKIVMMCDGYYYTANQPGKDSFMVDKLDVDECWNAVEEVRAAVMKYCSILTK